MRVVGGEKCPHCGKVMEPGSTFGDAGRRFHRPCVARGPIGSAPPKAAGINDTIDDPEEDDGASEEPNPMTGDPGVPLGAPPARKRARPKKSLRARS